MKITMKRTDLSNIMRRAWALFRTTGKTFSVCLSKAWGFTGLPVGCGAVSFGLLTKRADGTLRRACGTLQDIAATIKGTGRPDDGRTVKYYDIEAAGWRSFKVETL